MKEDLTASIDKDIKKVISMFVDFGWALEDFDYVWKNLEIPEFYSKDLVIEKNGNKRINPKNFIMANIFFSPKIIHYTDEVHHNKKSVSTVWVKCEICSETKESVEVIAKLLKHDLFPRLPIKPFRDGCSMLDCFSLIYKKGLYFCSSFYLNPDYKKGCYSDDTIAL